MNEAMRLIDQWTALFLAFAIGFVLGGMVIPILRMLS
jgi:type II secretory pathway component PulF